MTEGEIKGPPSVALIGAGAMGAALLKRWLDGGAIDAKRSAAFDPAPSADVTARAGAAGVAVNPKSGVDVDVVVLAIKPQMLGEARAFAAMAREALVISVLAGKSIAAVSGALGGATRIVRAMPNLASMVGVGAAGLYASPAVDDADRDTARALMAAVGVAVYVESEAMIDAVTAVSGSGPAYFFLMAEALEEAARDLGLAPAAAAVLARQTLAGAGAVAGADARTLADLRRAVTSPGGTTEAALRALDGDDRLIRTLMKTAAGAAVRRARDLSD